jgi:hypothetical protein
MSVTDKSNLINKDTSSERQLLDQSITEESSNKVKKVELEIETESEKEDASIPPPENEVGKRKDALISLPVHLIFCNLFVEYLKGIFWSLLFRCLLKDLINDFTDSVKKYI